MKYIVKQKVYEIDYSVSDLWWKNISRIASQNDDNINMANHLRGWAGRYIETNILLSFEENSSINVGDCIKIECADYEIIPRVYNNGIMELFVDSTTKDTENSLKTKIQLLKKMEKELEEEKEKQREEKEPKSLFKRIFKR